MLCYASRTGTRRNLDALRRAGWGLLVSRAGVWRTEGFDRIVGDNGAWADFQAGRSFDEDAFDRFLNWLSVQPVIPDWIVLPDIVAGGLRSLELSIRFMNRCLSVAPLVLIAVQDGMEHSDLAPFVGPKVGIFLGGSTEWKLSRMEDWGAFCQEKNIHYHVARVNTLNRIYKALSAGAHSIDGSSASRYAVSLRKLAYAARSSIINLADLENTVDLSMVGRTAINKPADLLGIADEIGHNSPSSTVTVTSQATGGLPSARLRTAYK